jgi:hypothetical protein
MKADIQSILEKQAAWQRSRIHLSWSEKLRISIHMRQTVTAIRKRSSGQNRAKRNRL